MLEKLERLIFLYDFYGPLLTARQKQAIELYYEADLSLSEVAQQMDITRQGVYDLLKRTEYSLEAYESRLQLAARFQEERRKIAEAYRILNRTEVKDKPRIEEAARILAEYLGIESSAEGSDAGGI